MLNWLLGSGAQLDTIEHSLKDSIIHFNENFAKISVFDGQVVESFDRLEKDISSLAQIEQTLQDQIADLQVFVRLQNIKTHYLFSRIQHEIALHRLLQESKLVQNLRLLTRSLFGSNERCIPLPWGSKIKLPQLLSLLQIRCESKNQKFVWLIL